jgi:hypothetical protein
MIAIDACCLSLLINPFGNAPTDPTTNLPVSDIADRYAHFLDQIAKQHNVLLIPAPALAEALIIAGPAGPAFVQMIAKSAYIKVGPFDELAAIELAHLTQAALASPTGKKGGSTQSWQKVKYDRQVIAIANVYGAGTIYSDDQGIQHFAKLAGISVVQTCEMPLPPKSATAPLFPDTP